MTKHGRVSGIFIRFILFYFILFYFNYIIFLTTFYLYVEAISEEAVNVFELNEGLFTVLKAPSSQTSAQTPPEVPLLGNPTATPSPPPSPIVVAQNEGTTEKTYSLSSILAVVLAMSLAHFALVVGGFTGEKGYAKFQAVQQWIDSFVH